MDIKTLFPSRALTLTIIAAMPLFSARAFAKITIECIAQDRRSGFTVITKKDVFKGKSGRDFSFRGDNNDRIGGIKASQSGKVLRLKTDWNKTIEFDDISQDGHTRASLILDSNGAYVHVRSFDCQITRERCGPYLTVSGSAK